MLQRLKKAGHTNRTVVCHEADLSEYGNLVRIGYAKKKRIAKNVYQIVITDRGARYVAFVLWSLDKTGTYHSAAGWRALAEDE